jgi:hypothetical protein
VAVIARALAIVALVAAMANAQPPAESPRDAAATLREGNAAATAGEWQRVATLLGPIINMQLPPVEVAEAQLLYGLALFFGGFPGEAEPHLVEYLKLVPDQQAMLDESLYPPEANKELLRLSHKHESEILRARRPKPRGNAALSLLPPVAYWVNNRQHTKAIVVGGALVGLTAASFATNFVLRDWCRNNPSCDGRGHSTKTAEAVFAVNIATGVAAIVTYLYGALDSYATYKRQAREPIRASISPVSNGAVVGISGSW